MGRGAQHIGYDKRVNAPYSLFLFVLLSFSFPHQCTVRLEPRVASVRCRVPSPCESVHATRCTSRRPTDAVCGDTDEAYLQTSASERTASCHDWQTAGHAYERCGPRGPCAQRDDRVNGAYRRRAQQLVSEPVRSVACIGSVVGSEWSETAADCREDSNDLTVGTKGTSFGYWSDRSWDCVTRRVWNTECGRLDSLPLHIWIQWRTVLLVLTR